jgi:hypothetical protein
VALAPRPKPAPYRCTPPQPHEVSHMSQDVDRIPQPQGAAEVTPILVVIA